MKKILCMLLLTVATAFSQSSYFGGNGGVIKTNKTGQIVSTLLPEQFDNGPVNGTFSVVLPSSFSSGDILNGGCFVTGGSFNLNLTEPFIHMEGVLGSNTGTCPNGPQWLLNPDGANYSYTLEFSLVDGPLTYQCVLRTVTDYSGSLWTGRATVQEYNCSQSGS